MGIKIALAGNPNCGKTTLFNDLTGSAQYVGNWPGVTVEKKESPIKKSIYDCGEALIAVDLPGAYSMSPFTSEESITSEYVKNEKPDVIISSGAAVAVPFFYIGKLMGAKLIYIEVYDRIDKSTITGRIVYPIADRFIVQWEDMLKLYPKAPTASHGQRRERL